MVSSNNNQTIKVLIGQIKIAKSPQILESVLGSCIGLVLFDLHSKVCGMAHILLPESNNKDNGGLPGKYAASAIINVHALLLKNGAIHNNIRAKYAGGAQMFQTSIMNNFNIGEMNSEAVKKTLNEMKIPVLASEVGKNFGRKIEFNSANFSLSIEGFNQKRYAV